MNSRLLFDQEILKKNDFLLGLDEVGWGCIAGDLVLGAVVVHKDFFSKVEELIKDNPWILDVRDSKKLSESKREKIYEAYQKFNSQNLVQSIIGQANPEEINSLGLAKAFDLCVHRILEKAPADLLIILDGKRVPSSLADKNVQLVIKGDDTSWVIGLGSIMAKVHRDHLMKSYDSKYPEYGFSNHVGYGVSAHVKALQEHGLTPIHRAKATTTILENAKAKGK